MAPTLMSWLQNSTHISHRNEERRTFVRLFSRMVELTPRLKAIADFVANGAVLADIGTDHAYLPLALAEQSRIVRAVASDVHQGPVDRANANVTAHGMDSIITVQKADGLAGIEAYCPTDIVIAGMGGDLIATILQNAPWVRDAQYHLILQPMTKAEHLRHCLWENGYAIENEAFVQEELRVYQVLSCRYTAERTPHTKLDTYTGKLLSTPLTTPQNLHLQSLVSLFEKKLAGMALTENVSNEEKVWLQSAINDLTERTNKGVKE